MRSFRTFATVSFLLVIGLTSIASAEIKIKVVDPSDAAVAGAQVQLLKTGKPNPASVLITSAEGMVIFRETASSAHSRRYGTLFATGHPPTPELPRALTGSS